MIAIPVLKDDVACFGERLSEMNKLGYFYHQTSDLVLRKQFKIIGFFIKEDVDSELE